MKTYLITYHPITGDLRALHCTGVFELINELERLMYDKYVLQDSIIIKTIET